jgi:aconitase A
MKVKIGEVIYDSAAEPVMVILSAADKANISNMLPEATRYASFPDGWGTSDEMLAWMKTPNVQGEALPTAKQETKL